MTIQCVDIYYSYPNGVQALKGVSLDLSSGCVAIVGENGSGKTTLAKTLNGLYRPSQGRVLVDERDAAGLRVAALARQVGIAFQNPDDQLFHSSVRDEVCFGPRNLGYSEARTDELAAWAMNLLGIANIERRAPLDLERSWRKRVAVASVVAMDTPHVVLDEPTGGQDEPGVAALGRAVEDLRRKGKLVLLITHDIEFAVSHADRVIALYDGRILLDGDPESVFWQFEQLAQTYVTPPVAAQIAKRLGLDRVISVSELVERV